MGKPDRQCFRNRVAPNAAKMRFRPKGGIAFLPPDVPPANTFKTQTKQPAKSTDFAGCCKRLYSN